MHCNLRPPDATLVLFRFNYDGIHLMAIHCVAAEHGGLIKIKEEKNRKESSCVKLKAFLTNKELVLELRGNTLCHSAAHIMFRAYV